MSKDCNKISFKALVVYTKEEDEAYIVGLADKEDDPENYVIFQRSVDIDPEAENAELNNYFLEISNPANSGYGGIVNVKLSERSLAIKLAANNSYSNGLEEIEINLYEGVFDRDGLRKYMQLIFDGTDCSLTIQ